MLFEIEVVVIWLALAITGMKMRATTLPNFASFLTHWVWLLTIFYFVGDIALRHNPKWSKWFHTLFLIPTLSLSWSVFFGVMAVLYLNPGLITSHEFTGLALLVDRVFHILPTLWMTIFIAARRRIEKKRWSFVLTLIVPSIYFILYPHPSLIYGTPGAFDVWGVAAFLSMSILIGVFITHKIY